MLTVQQEMQVTGQPEAAVRAARTVTTQARAWEQAQLAALEPEGVTDIPYGSERWLALPLNDPRRSAALLRAAAAWREHCAELPERIICQTNVDSLLGERVRAEVYDELAAEQAREWGLLAGWAKELASVPTVEEQDKAREFRPIREVRATAGWPPVAIPGRPGWWRHLIDGQQVDLPTRERLEAAA